MGGILDLKMKGPLGQRELERLACQFGILNAAVSARPRRRHRRVGGGGEAPAGAPGSLRLPDFGDAGT